MGSVPVIPPPDGPTPALVRPPRCGLPTPENKPTQNREPIMIFWLLSIPLSVALLVWAAAGKPGNPDMAYVHLAIACISAICFALVAIRGTGKLVAENASRPAVSASSAWYMGYVWAWGTLGLLATYATGVAFWHEWLSFFAALLGSFA